MKKKMEHKHDLVHMRNLDLLVEVKLSSSFDTVCVLLWKSCRLEMYKYTLS